MNRQQRRAPGLMGPPPLAGGVDLSQQQQIQISAVHDPISHAYNQQGFEALCQLLILNTAVHVLTSGMADSIEGAVRMVMQYRADLPGMVAPVEPESAEDSSGVESQDA